MGAHTFLSALLSLTLSRWEREQSDISTYGGCQGTLRAASAGGMGLALLRVQWRLKAPIASHKREVLRPLQPHLNQ